MSKITDKVTEIAQGIVEENGCRIWNVEYVKEAGTYFLRLFIDKDGGVGIDDCEKISRALDPVLDEYDPIPDSYVFEVGSAGIERELVKPSHFEAFLGSEVEVKTFRPVDGKKSFVGLLEKYEDGNVTIKQGNNDVTIEKADVAKVNLHVSF